MLFLRLKVLFFLYFCSFFFFPLLTWGTTGDIFTSQIDTLLDTVLQKSDAKTVEEKTTTLYMLYNAIQRLQKQHIQKNEKSEIYLRVLYMIQRRLIFRMDTIKKNPLGNFGQTDPGSIVTGLISSGREKNTSSGNTDTISGSWQKELFAATNKERENVLVSGLIYDDLLGEIAQRHAEDMQKNNYFSHTNLSGESPFVRMKIAGYALQAGAENIAMYNGGEIKDVIYLRMQSAGHKKNILNPIYTQIGLGRAGSYWVQVFGTPME